MVEKVLFVLKHPEPIDDLAYVKEVASRKNVKVKLLVLNMCYVFKKISVSESYSTDWEIVKINQHLEEILKYGEVAIDNKFSLSTPTQYYPDNAGEYGRYMRFKESGIKEVDPYHYVANAVAEGYSIVKW